MSLICWWLFLLSLFTLEKVFDLMPLKEQKLPFHGTLQSLLLSQESLGAHICPRASSGISLVMWNTRSKRRKRLSLIQCGHFKNQLIATGKKRLILGQTAGEQDPQSQFGADMYSLLPWFCQKCQMLFPGPSLKSIWESWCPNLSDANRTIFAFQRAFFFRVLLSVCYFFQFVNKS